MPPTIQLARRLLLICLSPIGIMNTGSVLANPPPAAPEVTIDWDKTICLSRSDATLQVVVNPPLRRGSAIHDSVFKSLRDLGADQVRYVPWMPYPRLGVAELDPPTATKTSWDFGLIDPLTVDFFNATQGHETILNFSTIPQWLFKTDKPVAYPANPDQPIWNYSKGTELRDPSCKELGDYYGRLVSWYTRGGFTDELGVYHKSNYHFDLPWWEVLNEIDSEHSITPKQYSDRYDAIVTAIHEVSPKTRFVGLALGGAGRLQYYTYFLDAKNHRAGIPLDMISYHFYAKPSGDVANPDQWHFCQQADKFLTTVTKIQAIRQKLSPNTQTTIDEIGVIAHNDRSWKNLPIYWNATAAMYAYLYVELTKLGIEHVGESQLVGYPTQFPSVSMVNWDTGKPNARFWVLHLLKKHFGPGDTLCASTVTSPDVSAQAFKTSAGRELLLINKSNSTISVVLPPEWKGSPVETVDATTGEDAPRESTLVDSKATLLPFAVEAISLGH